MSAHNPVKHRHVHKMIFFRSMTDPRHLEEQLRTAPSCRGDAVFVHIVLGKNSDFAGLTGVLSSSKSTVSQDRGSFSFYLSLCKGDTANSNHIDWTLQDVRDFFDKLWSLPLTRLVFHDFSLANFPLVALRRFLGSKAKALTEVILCCEGGNDSDCCALIDELRDKAPGFAWHGMDSFYTPDDDNATYITFDGNDNNQLFTGPWDTITASCYNCDYGPLKIIV